jgi:hypothetical protein
MHCGNSGRDYQPEVRLRICTPELSMCVEVFPLLGASELGTFI